MISGCKSIAEYAIKKWMEDNNLDVDLFTVRMDGNMAEVIDLSGDIVLLVYDPGTKLVSCDE